MANVQTEIKVVEFVIEDELTHCNIFYISSEPSVAAWSGGWKTKAYPASKSIRDIINSDDIADYILWNTGRVSPKSE